MLLFDHCECFQIFSLGKTFSEEAQHIDTKKQTRAEIFNTPLFPFFSRIRKQGQRKKCFISCSVIAVIAGMMSACQDTASVEPSPMAIPVVSAKEADIINLEILIRNLDKKFEENKFENDIAIPSTLYFMDDWQNDYFIQPIIKRWRPNDDYVVFDLDKGNFLRRLSTVVSIKRPVDNAVLSAKLINSDKFETVKVTKSTLKVASKNVDNGTVYAQIIGDSYTNGGFYKSALIDNNLVPNLKLIGLRKNGEGYYDEGRGGWSLASYFSVPKNAITFHGFMHPEGDYRYWGSKEFWINAHLCARNKQPEGTEPKYSCSRYDDYINMFDEETGLLLSPSAGDLQYDNASDSFILYDGNEWIKTDQKFNWGFDYEKYLSMFHLPAPDFVFIELGLNDFLNNIKADFTTWEQRIYQMHRSILKANDKCKIAICIPCSTCGSIENDSGFFTPMQDAAMWRFRSWLIETFDHKENESIYLLDTGACIDPENGYRHTDRKELTQPFFNSPTSAPDLRIQTGVPHPYLSYPQTGIPLAAFIQYYRNEIHRSASPSE